MESEIDFTANPFKKTEVESTSGLFSYNVYNLYIIIYAVFLGFLIVAFVTEFNAVKLRKNLLMVLSLVMISLKKAV